MHRKRLSDILQTSSDRDALRRKFADVKAADEYGVLPAGEYVARIIDGECVTSKSKGTPGYKLTFSIVEGELVGRRFWHELWLTDGALTWTKLGLGKIGVTDIDQLEHPLPQGIICKVRLVVRTNDNGAQWNQVGSFNVLRIEEPKPDPFAPQDGNDAEAGAA